MTKPSKPRTTIAPPGSSAPERPPTPIGLETTIPMLPDSIAASLQSDLLEYLVELKFLLLFFEKPHAILSTTGLDFINSDTVDDIRRGRTPKTNVFGEQNLTHVEILATEDWAEALSHCETHEYEIRVSKQPTDHFVSDASSRKVDEILEVTGEGMGLSTDEVKKRFLLESQSKDDELTMFFQLFLRIDLNRYLEVLELSRERRIPMIWTHEMESFVSNVYTRYLLLQLESESRRSLRAALKAALRMAEGSRLLRQVLKLEVVNVAAIPVERIVSFRQKNQDLLRNFLTTYRGFLADVQANPAEVDSLVDQYTQQLVTSLNDIQNEVALRRRKRGYEFLRRIGGDNFFDAASKAAPWAAFSFLLSPWLAPIIAAVGIGGKTVADQFIGEREKQLELLYRNSMGYLWKAQHELKS